MRGAFQPTALCKNTIGKFPGLKTHVLKKGTHWCPTSRNLKTVYKKCNRKHLSSRRKNMCEKIKAWDRKLSKFWESYNIYNSESEWQFVNQQNP